MTQGPHPFVVGRSVPNCAPWKGVFLQWVKSHPATRSLQPVASGAAREVTILPKPLLERVASGDSASR